MYIYILHFWESIQVLRRGVTTFWEMFGFGKELFYWPTQFWFCAPPGSGITKVWWLRGIRRCSDRLDKIRTHLRVYQLINCIIKASVLCKWLRHSHVTASMPSFGTGCVSWYQSLGCNSRHLENFLVSSVRTIPPHSEPRSSDEPNFPDIVVWGETIAIVIQSII